MQHGKVQHGKGGATARRWQALGSSIRGESHRRAGLPNQDALKILSNAHEGDSVIVALSDGHGSAKTFRSDIGARVAVATATSVVRQFLLKYRDASPADVVHEARRQLPGLIHAQWLTAARQDYEKRPFSKSELDALSGKTREKNADKELRANPLLAYGATVVVVAATGRTLLFVQLGDGDILTVSDNGKVSRPLPPDDRLIANETTSLCTADPQKDFRIEGLEAIDSVKMVVVATDGYANSFPDEAGFLKVGTDLWRMIQEKGPTWVSEQLESWLAAASEKGSGDDISVGILYQEQGGRHRVDVPPAIPQSTKRSTIAVVALAALVAGLLGGLGVGRLFGSTEGRAPRNPEVSQNPGPVWVTAPGGRLIRIDPGTGSGIATPALLPGVEGEIAGVAADQSNLWVALTDGHLVKMAHTTGAPLRRKDLGTGLGGIAVAEGSVWVASTDGRTVFQVDPRTLSARRSLPVTDISAGATPAGEVTPVSPRPSPTAG